ncbi:hypothetical protein HOC73_00620, partial [bacterium]|nr:hypothetical protein [bacterium]
MVKNKNKLKVWIVTVNMGYGHMRAAFPLKHMAHKGIIIANDYPGIPKKDKKTWLDQRKFYEAISRFKKVPIAGNAVFGFFNLFQKIPKFYPKRDLSRPNLQVLSTIYMAKRKDWGKHLINKLAKTPLAFVTPFFATAFMAEVNNYPNDIFCIICDADMSRTWAALNPAKSRIKYLAPNQRVVDRLKLYGVPEKNIFLTGFPLPIEILGKESCDTAKLDLAQRLINLDPDRKYISKYKKTLVSSLKIKSFPKKSDHLLTLTFAVGGAGAQRELGGNIVKGLAKLIRNKEIRINLIAGVHKEVNTYFKKVIKQNKLSEHLGKEVRILYTDNKKDYFKEFNKWIRTTDVLWTKPSELVFYSGLGLPIIIAPPIGSQEFFNQKYLINLGAGINQEDIRYVDEWLVDWIKSGRLAEAAAQGYLEAPNLGTYNIEKVLSKHIHKLKKIKTISP